MGNHPYAGYGRCNCEENKEGSQPIQWRMSTMTRRTSGVSNLMSIYSAISGKTFEEIETMYDGQGYGTFKKDVADLVVEELSPIRSRYDELTGTPRTGCHS